MCFTSVVLVREFSLFQEFTVLLFKFSRQPRLISSLILSLLDDPLMYIKFMLRTVKSR